MPAFALEISFPHLAQFCFLDRLCESLQQEADFRRLEFQ
jgi:hypothetical protein